MSALCEKANKTHVMHDKLLQDDRPHLGDGDLPLFKPLCAIHGAANGCSHFRGEIEALVQVYLVTWR